MAQGYVHMRFYYIWLLAIGSTHNYMNARVAMHKQEHTAKPGPSWASA